MQDRRIRKSKTALKNALLDMLKKKELTKITIKELCELADVNRSTFYSNYEDIYGLLKELHYDMLDKVSESIDENWWETHGDDEEVSFKNFQKSCYSIMENKHYFMLFANNNVDNVFVLNMCQYYKEKQKIDENDDYQNHLFTYHTMGYSATIFSWIHSGCRMSCDELAELLWKEATPFHHMMKNRSL